MPLPLLVLAACGQAPSPTVGAAPPTVHLASPADGSAWRSVAPVVLTGMVVDDAAPPPALVVEVWADGVLRLRVAPGERGGLDAELALPVGVHALEVRAVDPDGNTGVAAVGVSVVEEYVLAAPSITLIPAAPVTGDTIRAELADASARLTYVWRWTRDGTPVDTTAPVIPGSEVWVGQAWVVAAYATDGVEFSPTTTATVTVADATPTVGVVQVVPAGATTADELTCEHAEPVDPEAEPLDVAERWWLDGVEATTTGPTLPAGTAARGVEVVCTVEVAEPDGRVTVATSSPLVVENALPTVAAVTLAPSAPTELDTLTCAVGAVSDADGDRTIVSLVWSVAGSVVGTGETLTGADFARGDEVRCGARADDGIGAGPTTWSDPTTIQDSPPTAPTVGFRSTVVVPGRAAVCGVLEPSTDPDGDVVTYTWAWTVDGVPTGETADTLDTTGLAPGSSVACAATPTDRRLDGPAGSASVVLASPTAGDHPLAEAPLTLTAAGATTGFGAALLPAGDVDGDGITDLVVGSDAGAWLYDGAGLRDVGAWTTADAARAWTGEVGAGLGAAGTLGAPGDLDGDGRADLTFAEPAADQAGGDAGRLWIVYAGDGLLADVAGGWIDGDPGAGLGAGSSGGDLDGDGLADLVVTAPGDARGGSAAGAVGIFLGGAAVAGLADADVIVIGGAGDGLGASLAVTPDLDGDGRPDLLLGAPGADPLATDGGAAYALPGTLGGAAASLARLVLAGETVGAGWGRVVAAPGDLDGDGVADLLVAATSGDGSLCLLPGGATGTLAPTDTSGCVTGGSGAGLGAAVAALDLDGDEVLDLLVGAPGAASVSLYAGHSPWPSSPVATWLGAADRAGAAIATGLRRDADGYDSFAVGAPDAGAGGTVHLLSGP